MNIAHFVHRYPPALGGSESYFARLSRYLAEEGEQVRVWTTNALDLEAFWSRKGSTLPSGVEMDDWVEVHRYPIRHWSGQRYMLYALSLIPYRPLQCMTLPCNPIAIDMWRDSGQGQNIDIVHATAFPYAWPIGCALRLARRCDVPFVLTPFLHLGNPDDPNDRTRRSYLSGPMRYLLEAADHIFVQTTIERDALIEIGLPKERLTLQGMGVDLAECTGGDRVWARRAWGIETDEIVIGHLANKSVEKGTVDLHKAANALWKRGLKFRVVLAGPEMPNFIRYWIDLPAPQNAVRLGVLSEEEKRDFFSAIDVFAMPSKSDSFGIVFLEAWANGVPCIGYRAGGVAGLIRDECDGLLVECGNLEQLENAIKKLVIEGAIRKRFGEAGRDRIESEFKWKPKLDLVHQVYRDLIERKRLTPSRKD